MCQHTAYTEYYTMKDGSTSRPRPTQTEVLTWLQASHPELHAKAEIDKAWVWIAENLSGDHNKPTRASLKANGFRYCKKGHALPSGKVGTWANSCTAPLPFFRRGKGGGRAASTTEPTTEPEPTADALMAEAMAFANA